MYTRRMLSVADVHRLAAALPPYQATAAVMLSAAAVALVVGWVRGGRTFLAWVPGLVFWITGTALFWPLFLPRLPGWASSALIATASCAFALHAMLHAREWRALAEPGDASRRAGRIYLALGLAITTVLLFYRLGTYHGILVAWEAPVVEGFGEAFLRGQGVLSYLKERFLWDDGVLSGGQTSLFFGAPTYAFFKLAGFSPFTLRLAAPLATLIAVVVIYLTAARFFGPTAGTATALIFALDPAVLFYGRYGSSPAGTVLAVLLALSATWWFFGRNRPAWWMGPLCAVTLFLATLQYSPARVVVLILLAMLFANGVWNWRRLGWGGVLGLALVALGAVAAWRFEGHFGRQHLFLHARGEQFFSLVQDPSSIEALISRKLPNLPPPGRPLSLQDKLRLLPPFLEITIPQYVNLLLPTPDRPAQGLMFGFDPPPLPLYYAPAVLFILLGMVYSLARLPAFTHLCLWAWGAGLTAPLLLTNRVDVHRAWLLVVPLCMWAGFGVREAARLLRAARLPQSLQHAIAAGLLITLVYNSINFLYANVEDIPKPVAAPILSAEIATIRQPLLIGWEWDNREVSLLQLEMLERMRENPGWVGSRMPQALRYALDAEQGEPAESAVRQLQQAARTSTVILAPAARFRAAGAAAQRKGLRVAERGAANFRFLRIDSGAQASGVPDEDVKPLPTIVIPPTPTPIPLAGGPLTPLTRLEPRDVSFGFAPPRIGRAWDGGPIKMNGIVYGDGIGMHAWARMTFSVPPNATALQAIIGLSDTIKDCNRASVVFEVRDQNDAVLFKSSVVDTSTGPTPIRVPLQGATAVTLAVGDADDGIDCDHADWAVPSFLLGPR